MRVADGDGGVRFQNARLEVLPVPAVAGTRTSYLPGPDGSLSSAHPTVASTGAVTAMHQTGSHLTRCGPSHSGRGPPPGTDPKLGTAARASTPVNVTCSD